MVGRNTGICHSCRAKSHFFNECPKKRPCPSCKRGFEKCFVVEKNTVNKGKLFLCCSNNCGFWEWVVKENSGGATSASSSVSATVGNPLMEETVDEISRTLESRIQLNDQEELRISMDVTIRMDKISGAQKPKGELPDGFGKC